MTSRTVAGNSGCPAVRAGRARRGRRGCRGSPVPASAAASPTRCRSRVPTRARASAASRPARSSRSAWRRASASPTSARAPVGSGWARRVATTARRAPGGSRRHVSQRGRVASSAQCRSSSTTRTGRLGGREESPCDPVGGLERLARRALVGRPSASPARSSPGGSVRSTRATATAAVRRRPASTRRARRRTPPRRLLGDWSVSQVLPMPGSPTSRAVAVRPRASSSACSAARSVARPTARLGGRRGRALAGRGGRSRPVADAATRRRSQR